MSFQQHKRKRLIHENKEPSMTKQSLQNEVDVNMIVERFNKNGTLPNRIQENPIYGEFVGMTDFATAHNIVAKAQEQFMGLDAKTRARFENDPAKFLQFAENPKNMDEMIELGLAKRREQPAAAAPAAKPAASTSKKKVDEPPSED